MKVLSDAHACANRPRGFWLALILAGLWGSAGSAQASDYKLSIVAKTGDTIDGNTLTFVGPATINNAGTVAFVAGFSDQIGVFRSLEHPCGTERRRGDHQPDRKLLVKTGDTIDGLTPLDFGTPVLNDRGTVAFIGTYESLGLQSAIFETHESEDCAHVKSEVLVKAGDMIAGHTLGGFGSTVTAQPAIDNRGRVFFWAFFDSGTGAGIFMPSALLVSTQERNPSTDGHGNVVIMNFTSNGGGIFTQSSPLVESGDIIQGLTLLSFGDGPAVNHRGTVAFIGTFDDQSVSQVGIFTTREIDGRPGDHSRLLVRTGDIIDGLTLTGLFSPIAINAPGTVAFAGIFSGGTGIFTQSALVAREGDIVDANVLGDLLVLRHQDINNAGEIVFEARFSDGSTGIILAEPRGNGHDPHE
jgi:hypothetical protein